MYRGSEGIFVVFDLTKQDTFDHIANWIDDIHRHTPPDLPIILIGNKSDLAQRRKISREQAIDLAQELGISYMETSALNASNVETAFTMLVKNIYQKKKSAPVNQPLPNNPAAPGLGRSVPVVAGPIDETTVGQDSFRLKNTYDDDDDDEVSSRTKKDGRCCKTS